MLDVLDLLDALDASDTLGAPDTPAALDAPDDREPLSPQHAAHAMSAETVC
ncbi:hypothetical protein [Burkholderia vietnamiensis]|uniref:hypothetical protein n=1 Tax=Burkholderia vietnamiensis TaxID=60552 RepID=UPI0012D9A3B3|nr:hypothetical protein [Burkholderia vietnamiensis]